MLNMYSLKDNKINSYSPPVCLDNVVQLQRSLTSVVNNKETDYYKYPQDFEVYTLGTFDTQSGVITCLFVNPEWVLCPFGRFPPLRAF